MKYCKKCGAQLDDDAMFCGKCGADNAPVAPAAPRPAPTPAPRQDNGNTKKVLIIVIGAVLIAAIAAFLIIFLTKNKHPDSVDYPNVIAEETKKAEDKVKEEAKPDETFPVKAEEPEETEEIVIEEDMDPDSFVGYWSGSDRWGVEITKAGSGQYIATFAGSDSAYSGSSETMGCYFEDGKLVYKDGALQLYNYGTGDGDIKDPATIFDYTNAKGHFEFAEPGFVPDDIVYSEYGKEIKILTSDLYADDDSNTRYIIWVEDMMPRATDEYVVWNSADSYIGDIEFISCGNKYALRLAKNEIYARHGRKFNDSKLQKHFETCSWYRGTIEPEAFDENKYFNDCEKANIKSIVAIEDSTPQYESEYGTFEYSFSTDKNGNVIYEGSSMFGTISNILYGEDYFYFDYERADGLFGNVVLNDFYGVLSQKFNDDYKCMAWVYSGYNKYGEKIYVDFFPWKGVVRCTDENGLCSYYCTDYCLDVLHIIDPKAGYDPKEYETEKPAAKAADAAVPNGAAPYLDFLKEHGFKLVEEPYSIDSDGNYSYTACAWYSDYYQEDLLPDLGFDLDPSTVKDAGDHYEVDCNIYTYYYNDAAEFEGECLLRDKKIASKTLYIRKDVLVKGYPMNGYSFEGVTVADKGELKKAIEDTGAWGYDGYGGNTIFFDKNGYVTVLHAQIAG